MNKISIRNYWYKTMYKNSVRAKNKSWQLTPDLYQQFQNCSPVRSEIYYSFIIPSNKVQSRKFDNKKSTLLFAILTAYYESDSEQELSFWKVN